ncbi:type III secretion system outer membrane ring subunit SctC [Marinomonas lutimaris]|uniref:type III secretion system outer membrane ring subunit SctC n=1 Tax=Marinomonas lutimaris TaxID=2846746 RepID=UPI001CA5D93E|nr:type III secretion system outer membrane ring subunit SctC [Marinomonas lutimaris]
MRKISFVFILLIGLWNTQVQSAVPELWKKNAYAYDADNTSLEDALNTFAKTFGVSLNLDRVKGVVEGKIRANSAVDFLNRLGMEHQFLWFVYNGTLYISPLNDQRSVSLDVSKDAISDLKEALLQVGLLEERFGWGELPDEGTVIISGPRKYVDFIRSLTKKKKKGDDKYEVMVFPLKYALADNRTIQYREKDIEIPGVASMLQSLFDEKSSTPMAMNTLDMTLGSSMQALDSLQDLARQRAQSKMLDRSTSQEQIASRLSDKKKKNSKISADIRNNAILIMDDYEKHDMYQKLIHQLDLPRSVIEIDAIILDIDKNKLQELGINWQGGSGSTEVSFNTSGTDPFLPSGSSATVLIQDFGHFFARIRAMESDGDASLVANPSILTIENQPAVIDFNNTSYISSIGERVANVTPITAGTSLQVVPRLIKDQANSLIQLSLDIEDGGIESQQDQNTPSVNRGSISTQAVVQAQRSLVIGGFRVERNTQQYNKIPLLGDIPGLGKLFSYSSNNQSKRERLFIITPRLVGNEVDPLKYVSSENREALASAIKSQEKKLAREHNKITRTEVSDAFADLVNLYVPEGFEPQTDIPFSLDNYCREEGPLQINKQNRQWYKGKKFNIVVGTIENQGLESVRFDEANCAQRDTIAVAVQPNAMLKPGESIEVILAVHLPTNSATTRSSLLAQTTSNENN